MFSQFGNSYIRRIKYLLHGKPSFQETLPAVNSANRTTWAIPEDFTMDLSQFYLALFARDKSGMNLFPVIIFYRNMFDIFWCWTLCRKTS